MDLFDLRLWQGFEVASNNSQQSAMIDQVTIDSRKVDSKQSLFVALEGSMYDGHQFVDHAAKSGARFALVKFDFPDLSQDSGITLLRVNNPLKAFQEIATAYRLFLNVEIVCIAGSYGKTMVKDLLHTLLGTKMNVVSSPESFNSQIGVPLSLLRIKKEHEIAVIEAGISEPQEMDALAKMISPNFGILTHIGNKHVATLGSTENITAEMLKIVLPLPKTGWAILPHSPFLKSHLANIQSEQFFWEKYTPTLPQANFLSQEHSGIMRYQVLFPDGEIFQNQTSSGFYYFIDLINIATKAAWLLGISSQKICEILVDYTPEPMRTEIWKSPIGTTFINDTYCSDPQSVDQALKYFDNSSPNQRKIFVFSGLRGNIQNPLRDYRRIGIALSKSAVNLVILVGDHPFDSLIAEIKKTASHLEIMCFANIIDAFTALRDMVTYNDIVLIKGEKKEHLDTVTEAFNDSICNNQCIINLAAIKTNIQTIRKKLPAGNRIMVMVKALAYGTDDIRMSKFLENCGIDILGVSYVDEGIALKRVSISQAIFVINAAIYEVNKIVKWHLEVGVSEKTFIQALAHEAKRHNCIIKVHLHIDTGMSRFGCRPEQALELAQLIKTLPNLNLNGIMTHFACAENPDQDEFTHYQANVLQNIVDEFKVHHIEIPWIHAANSSGALRFNFPKFNMVRIGLAVFGLYSSKATKESLELRLALSLISRIVGINICKSGETISYGRNYIVQKEKQSIAVLPIGYFDGLHRNYSGKGAVIIRGQKVPMVGNICMDFMMVDVTELTNVSIGDTVLIFGENDYGQYLSPEELALSGDSIVYELITCLGPRIQRIFVFEETNEISEKIIKTS